MDRETPPAPTNNATMKDETNRELWLAEQYVEETGRNLFLTGKAGTGKTTFLRKLKAKCSKRLVVVAPTGVAAINAGGVTIHSFFQLPFAPYIPGSTLSPGSAQSKAALRLSAEKRRIIRTLDLLVIDEISMVRADLLDHIDSVLRRFRHNDMPFGGVQLLMIGDMHQLAPVIKDEEKHMLEAYYPTLFFFGSHALQKTSFVTVELKKVYRQSDTLFLTLLNHIRHGQADSHTLAQLNRRYLPDFKPNEAEEYIPLTTHNRQAQEINDRCLRELPGRYYTYEAEVKGDFPESSYPTAARLELKCGAQIMFIKNDTEVPRRFYNGKIGRIHALSENRIEVICEDWDSPLPIAPMQWDNTQYKLNPESKEIEETVCGSFTHYPIRTAWAITIHKSQGLTFDRVIINAGSSFAYGQVYVALSRCRTLEGLVLSTPIGADNLIEDETVAGFSKTVSDAEYEPEVLREDTQAYRLFLLHELFDFASLAAALGRICRLLDEFLYRNYPKLLENFKQELALFPDTIHRVSERFAGQYTPLLKASEEDAVSASRLLERIAAAAQYFQEKLQPFSALLLAAQAVSTDNKTVRKRWEEALEEGKLLLHCKLELMNYATRGFSTQGYLEARAQALLPEEQKKSRTTRQKKSEPAKLEISSDLLHPELFEELRAWRNAKAVAANLPAYTVLQQKALIGIANTLPSVPKELLRIPYMGKKTVQLYAEEILSIVEKYKERGGLEGQKSLFD